MARTVTIRLDEVTYEVVRAAADADHRSIANLIETATLRHLEERSFMDAEEAAGVLADRDLRNLRHHSAKGFLDRETPIPARC